MNNTEKILKLLEFDGKLNYANNQVAVKAAEINGIGKCLSWLENAKRALESAREALAAERLESLLINDDLFPSFVSLVSRMSETREKAEAEKSEIIAEATNIEREIENLQSELRGQGIELNISQAKTPKISVI